MHFMNEIPILLKTNYTVISIGVVQRKHKHNEYVWYLTTLLLMIN